MVVGSLLVMAAQTVTAVPCSSITGSSSPTLAVLCEQPLYTESKLTSALNTECTNNPCSGGDAATCCEPAANCRTFGASNCTVGEAYTGGLKPDNDADRCSGAVCTSTDEAACCAQKAYCSTAI